MNNTNNALQLLTTAGFAMISNIFTEDEITRISQIIHPADTSKSTFRKSADLFAIRQFLHEIPDAVPLIFNKNLRKIISQLPGENPFVVKSIYFDKPPGSNWYVSWHQDLTISADQKTDTPGFGPWTVKTNQFAVQPPVAYLENLTTIRIHLDHTTADNGALKVIPGSHLKKIYRPETIDWNIEKEVCCEVPAGGIMLMKPLLLHSSSRTTNGLPRRVLHIELASLELPAPLQWAERMSLQ
ncbi:MAG: phytanoyl-CoA dioxygenase family protein [Chitinophaga sp.]|uniref:phytanoyl-CoA dioxygenase family protein n=1 Tax=Chitinophaga sp. TaxID=1869181 RepID=UPI0025BCF29E|nr:phytanoyl-CoA dioxygenase family protein [Chitinophaga sp.]MBV8252404.1 phytanoyl-CoA dioxygenase family protein [Chitinophaga sp.]